MYDTDEMQAGAPFSGKHIFIATPSYDDKVTVGYCVSLLGLSDLFYKAGVQTERAYVSHNALVHDARNRLVSMFLRSKATDMLFIDADIGFDPMAGFHLAMCDEDVVGGAYPRKTTSETVSYNFAINGDAHWTGRLIEVDYLGAGFLKISRKAILKMIEKWPEKKYEDPFGNETYALFDTDMTGGKVQGEDAIFMRRWKECGGTVWCYPDMMFSHTGSKIWTGNFMSVLGPALKAGEAA